MAAGCRVFCQDTTASYSLLQFDRLDFGDKPRRVSCEERRHDLEHGVTEAALYRMSLRSVRAVVERHNCTV